MKVQIRGFVGELESIVLFPGFVDKSQRLYSVLAYDIDNSCRHFDRVREHEIEFLDYKRKMERMEQAVRCEKCKYSSAIGKKVDETSHSLYCKHFNVCVNLDDFCSNGEKRRTRRAKIH